MGGAVWVVGYLSIKGRGGPSWVRAGPLYLLPWSLVGLPRAAVTPRPLPPGSCRFLDSRLKMGRLALL